MNNITHACPISREMILEPVARMVAGITTLILIGIFFFPSVIIPFILLCDFALKGFFKKPSPTKCLGRGLVALLGIKGKKVNAGPKIFAMKIGFWMSALLLLFALLKLTVPLFVLTGIFIVATGMEPVFNFCLGCKIFPYWSLIVKKFS